MTRIWSGPMRRAGSLSVAMAGLLGHLAPVAASGEEPPVCVEDRSPYKDWLAARLLPTGVTARSTDKFLVPTATATDDCNGPIDLSLAQSGRFDDGIHAWILASRCKEVVCGVADSLEPFCEGVFATGECDLNNNIFVADADGDEAAKRVRSLLTRHQCTGDTLELGPLGRELALEGGALCFDKPAEPGWLLHAEITGAHRKTREALKAAWATQEEYRIWKASVADTRMCVYGPLVGDTGHGLKAEVHPAEMLWWTRGKPADLFAAGGPYDLLLVQDASGRYGNEYGYVIREPFPETRVWRPWSQAPLTGQFEIAIRVAPADVSLGPCPAKKTTTTTDGARGRGDQPAPGKPVFTVEPWRACKGAPVITESRDEPALECVSQAAPRLYVNNAAESAGENQFDVSANWACRCEEAFCGGMGYLGYLRIDGSVGLDRDFWEGAIGLTVVDERVRPAITRPDCAPHGVRERTMEARRGTGSVDGRVRRILTKRSGKEQEKLLQIPPEPALLKTLLDAVGWPQEGLSRPPVANVKRPEKMRLEVATRVSGLEEADIQDIDIQKTWTVEVADLVAPTVWKPVVTDKQEDRVDFKLPRTDIPWKVRATVTLTTNDGRLSQDDPILQSLWSDRLALVPEETKRWIDEMSGLCESTRQALAMADDVATRRKAEELPSAVKNLLAETARRREVTMTTLAILAYLKNEGCRIKGPSFERQLQLR